MIGSRINWWLFGLTACLLSGQVSAQQYRFNYSKLYTQMKNNLKEGHPDVKVAFFFQEQETFRICNIDKAWMEKDEHYEEFTIPDSQELVVPIDNNLRQVGPLVYVDTEKGKLCDFSMVVMTNKPLQGQVTYTQIKALLPQMSKMLDDLGGMFSSWFSPEVIGLTLEFRSIRNGSITVSNGASINIENGKGLIKLVDLKEGAVLDFPQTTFRVLPLLGK